MIDNVDYHITDKCNLNCVSCNHFCPLVPKEAEHKSMKQIEKDLRLLSKFRNDIEQITILGGEPTLHPNLVEILYLTRKLFPENRLHLTTNGTLWNSFDKWKDAILDNNVIVLISIYPWTENYKEHIKHIINVIGENRCILIDCKFMQSGPFVLRRENTDEQILNCRMRHGCTQLNDGFLYICNYAAQIDYLYRSFPFLTNYIFREGYEKIDLNNTSMAEIEAMCFRSIPALCFYCNECKRSPEELNGDVQWKKSSKRIEEWIS